MAVEQVKLTADSFRTIYLRREDRVILRTETGVKIIIRRIIPDEWKPWRVYENEEALNDNKKEIFLLDRRYLPELTEEFIAKIRSPNE